MERYVEQLERQAEEAERRAAALRKIAEGAKELGEDGIASLRNLILADPPIGSLGPESGFQPLATPPASKVLRGRKAVLYVVRERPGIWRMDEIRAEIKRHGWFTSAKGVEVAVARLCTDGELKRVSKGRYVLSESERKEDTFGSSPAPWQESRMS